MKTSYMKALLAGGLMTLTTSLMAQSGPCLNSGSGQPSYDSGLGKLVCEVLVESENLAPQTFGLIKKVTVTSLLTLPGQLDEVLALLLGNPVKVPVQNIQLKILAQNDQIINIQTVLAPEITKSGDFCQGLKVTDFKLGVSQLTSPELPDFVENVLKNILNNNPEIKKKGMEAVEKFFKGAEPHICNS